MFSGVASIFSLGWRFAADAAVAEAEQQRARLSARWGASRPLLERFDRPVVFGSYALHQYMGRPSTWEPDDVDFAVMAQIDGRMWHASQVRAEVWKYRAVAERDGLCRVTSVAVNDHVLEKRPELYDLVDTRETRALQCTIDRVQALAAQARAFAAVCEENVAAQDSADKLDGDLALLQHAQVSHAKFVELKRSLNEQETVDPHFKTLFDVIVSRNGWREDFHEAVAFVMTCEFPEAARLKKHQLVAFTAPAHMSTLEEALEPTTDQPASVQLRLDGTFHVPKRTAEVVRTRVMLSSEICKDRRAKYEARGFTVVEG